MIPSLLGAVFLLPKFSLAQSSTPSIALTDYGPAVVFRGPSTPIAANPLESCLPGAPSSSMGLPYVKLVSNAFVSLFSDPQSSSTGNRCGQCLEIKCSDPACALSSQGPDASIVTVVQGSCRCAAPPSAPTASSTSTNATQSLMSLLSTSDNVSVTTAPPPPRPSPASSGRCCLAEPTIELNATAFDQLFGISYGDPFSNETAAKYSVWVRRVSCPTPPSPITLYIDSASSVSSFLSLRFGNIAGPGSFSRVGIRGPSMSTSTASATSAPSSPPVLPLNATWGASWEADFSSLPPEALTQSNLHAFPWTVIAVADFTGEIVTFDGVIQPWYLGGSTRGMARFNSSTSTFSLPETLEIQTDRQLTLPNRNQGVTTGAQAKQAADAQANAAALQQQAQAQAAATAATAGPGASSTYGSTGLPVSSSVPQQTLPQAQPAVTTVASQMPTAPVQPSTAYARPLGPGFDGAAAATTSTVVPPAPQGTTTVNPTTQPAGAVALGAVQPTTTASAATTPSGTGPSGVPTTLAGLYQAQQAQMSSGTGSGQPPAAPSTPLPVVGGSGPSMAAATATGAGPTTSSPSAQLSALPLPTAPATPTASQASTPVLLGQSTDTMPLAPFSGVMGPGASGVAAPIGASAMGSTTGTASGTGGGAPAAAAPTPAPATIKTVGGFTCTIPYQDPAGNSYSSCVHFQSVEGATFCFTQNNIWDVCQPGSPAAAASR